MNPQFTEVLSVDTNSEHESASRKVFWRLIHFHPMPKAGRFPAVLRHRDRVLSGIRLGYRSRRIRKTPALKPLTGYATGFICLPFSLFTTQPNAPASTSRRLRLGGKRSPRDATKSTACLSRRRGLKLDLPQCGLSRGVKRLGIATRFRGTTVVLISPRRGGSK